MGSEKFCLRWNDFENNISNALRELRDDKDFFDVTLACGDEQIQAHKVILSACSPFFRNILRRNPHQHPLLYLKGVRFNDLQFVLNFMYHGEVSVAQEDLNSFLAVAEEMKVKGLTQSKSPSQVKAKERASAPQQPKQTIKTRMPSNTTSSPASNSYYSTQNTVTSSPLNNSINKPNFPYDDEIQEVVPVKLEPAVRSLAPPPPPIPSPAPVHLTASETSHILAPAEEQYLAYQEDESYEDYGQYEEQGYQYGGGHAAESEGHKEQVETCINKIEENGAIYYSCTLCGKTCPRKDAIKTHVENIHFPGSYPCNHCDQVFNSKTTRNVHVGRKHKFQ